MDLLQEVCFESRSFAWLSLENLHTLGKTEFAAMVNAKLAQLNMEVNTHSRMACHVTHLNMNNCVDSFLFIPIRFYTVLTYS
jgi:hypothetical protein